MSINVDFLNASPVSIGEVIALSDKNKTSLGMLPYKAFEEAGEAGRIIVSWSDNELVGYLLYRFSIKTRDVSVTHFCVDDEFRGSEASGLLFDFLKSNAGEYRLIRLRCRIDYGLERFWARLGLFCKDEREGRSQAGVPLRLWTLSNPNKTSQAALEFLDQSLEKIVIDANVLYDLYSSDEMTDSRIMAGGWIRDIFRVCVTPEIGVEISRSSDKDLRAKQLRYVASNFEDLEVDASIFARARKSLYSVYHPSDENMKSDLNHIAYCLSGGAKYFVTRDEWIRKQGVFSFEGVEVCALRPSELAILYHSDVNTNVDGSSDRVVYGVTFNALVASDIDDVKHLFLIEDKANNLKEKLHFGLAKEGSFSGLIKDRGVSKGLFVCSVDNDDVSIDILRAATKGCEKAYLNYMLSSIVLDAYKNMKKRVVVKDRCLSSQVERFLLDFGFCLIKGEWVKLVLNDEILVDATCGYKTGFAKEKFVWPAKRYGDGFFNYIIPIRPKWAKELFDSQYASSDLFGASKKLHIGADNVYYRSTNGPVIRPKSRVLWYVSHDPKFPGSGAIRGCSLIGDVEVGSPTYLYKKYKKFGIYNFSDVLSLAKKGGDAMAIKFSHSESFSQGVAFKDAQGVLSDFGFGRFPFVGPLAIGDDVFMSLYRKLVAQR